MNFNQMMSKVFSWMFIGLLITFLTGFVVSMNPNMLFSVFDTGLLWILLIVEIALVVFFSTRIFKMKPLTAKICFILYSFVTGLTFSSYFIVYSLNSVVYVFLITAVIFALFAFFGSTTKLDLTKMGTYLLMGLLGIIIGFIINIFTQSSTFELVLTIISVIIFVGFTAHDVQKIKRLSDSNLPVENLPIYGALELYLDFINIFIDLIRLFGNSRDA